MPPLYFLFSVLLPNHAVTFDAIVYLYVVYVMFRSCENTVQNLGYSGEINPLSKYLISREEASRHSPPLCLLSSILLLTMLSFFLRLHTSSVHGTISRGLETRYGIARQ